MALPRPAFSFFRCLVLLFLQFGLCCTASKASCFPQQKAEARLTRRRRGVLKQAAFISPWPYLKRLWLSYRTRKGAPVKRKDDDKLRSPEHEAKSRTTNVPQKRKSSASLQDFHGSPVSQKTEASSLRTNAHPCTMCGEVFPKTHLLDHHQAIKHAVSELNEGDCGRNVVQIIFETSWMKRERRPQIVRILKIHNSPKILRRFEEYRELVKARASRAGSRRQQRCLVDGNELLRFHCSTFSCPLGYRGGTSLCNRQFCSVCGIIRLGFSSKLDGICTYSSSDKAHESISEDLEEEFSFMEVRRAILICRVIAGRVAGAQELELKNSYDSVAGNAGDFSGLEELYVFSPRAILPCFVIIYNM
ncbi:hypothetical protein EJ110_NYTH00190 [Nymphaea thermarum]|nr:hypothetical protein EJ110_NYTH00190 [Nymphaea thermarum]